MGGSSKKVTVGYEYYLGMHMILCHGPIDRIRWIKVDDRIAWQGSNTGGRINVSAEGLFGGESREGGVSGAVDIEMGGPTQGRNDYLQARLGSNIPAFRGVVGAVLRQCYLGLNPYLKKWAMRGQRIHVRQNGLPQWYDTRAEIPLLGNKGAPMPLLWTLPCQAPTADPRICQCPVSQNDTFNYVSAESGPQTINIRIRGVVEGQAYSFSPGYQIVDTSGPISVVKGVGSPTQDRVNVYTLTISNPPATYYLNHGSFDYDVHAVDFSFPVQVANGATVNLFCTSVDGAQANNRNNRTAVSDPNYSLGVNQPFNGQFLQLDGLFGHADMNPAHIIRECLTDPDWGMGYQESDIDDTSFMAAADTLFDEQMGISLLWDRQIPIEDFIKEIIKHINATLYVDRTTGKFVLKLIRDDYNVEDLLVIGEDAMEKVENASRPTFGELVNSVTINYWNASTGETASLTVQDQALIQMQGAVINTTLQYPGFTNAKIAAQVALRNLRVFSTPLLSCTLHTDRTAAQLNIGDAFVMNWPDLEINNVVVRISGMALGDGKSNKVKLTVMEDVFGLPKSAVVVPPDDGWTDPTQPAQPSPYRLALESPYYEVVQVLGQTDADSRLSSNPELGYTAIAAVRPGEAINATLSVNAGAGYEDSAVIDFCPTALLAVGVGPMDTVWTISDAIDLDLVEPGTHAQVDQELVRIDAIDTATNTLTVGRGVLDTVPRPHTNGARIFFWDVYSGSDLVEYVSGETVLMKVLPTTGLGTLSIAEAPEDGVTLNQRASRPYPPGNFKINTQYFPETIGGSDGLSLTWAHRDRRQQTGADYIDFTEGNIGPEAGTTYNVRIYNENNVLIHTESAISGTSFDYSTSDELDDNGGTAGDPYWSNVIFLTPFTSDFADKSSRAIATTNVGSCTIDSTDGAVGLGCLLAPVGGYIEASVDAKFGTSDFTIETYAKVSATSPAYFGIFAFEAAKLQDNGLWVITVNKTTANSGLTWVSSNGTSWNIFNATNVGAMNNNAWHHWALVRNGTSLRVYRDGVLVASATLAAGLNFTQKGTWTSIGVKNVSPSSGGDQPSRYQYTRITKGVARYTANFTPPTEFPTQAPVGRLNGKLRIELESERDSIVSYQAHNHTVERLGYGFNYGDRYGN